MQTKELYYDGIDILEFQANIISIEQKKEDYYVVLDQTAFYPEGGGMPNDTGWLDDIEVINVIKKDNVIYHILKEKPLNNQVHGKVDGVRRTRLIQIHDAQHLLSAIFEKYYGLITVSHHVHEDYCDLVLANNVLTDEIALEAQNLANKLIFEQRRLDTVLVAKKDLHKYNVTDNPKYSDPVRLTIIETLDDNNACGCLHFDNISKIQAVKCLKVEKVSNEYRILFTAGLTLIDYMNRTNDNYETIKTMYKANDNSIIDIIENSQNKTKETNKELEQFKSLYYLNLVNELSKETNFIKIKLDNSNDIKFITSLLLDYDKNVTALIQAEKEGKYQFSLVKQKTNEFDIEALFKKIKEDVKIFGGGKGLSITGQSEEDLLELVDKYL